MQPWFSLSPPSKFRAKCVQPSAPANLPCFSYRSFVLTLFAGISISYVLVAATACLGKDSSCSNTTIPWLQFSHFLLSVGLGWELGFLESILFAILIGISCDFVIHFGHAYTMYSGAVNRHYR